MTISDGFFEQQIPGDGNNGLEDSPPESDSTIPDEVEEVLTKIQQLEADLREVDVRALVDLAAALGEIEQQLELIEQNAPQLSD